MTPTPEQLDRLNDYLDDLGTPESRATFEAELTSDPALAELYERYQSSLGDLQTAFASPPDLRQLVSQAVQRAAAEEAGGEAVEVAPAPLHIAREPNEQADANEALRTPSAGDDAAESSDSVRPVDSISAGPPWWMQALKIAACIAIVSGVLVAGQKYSPFAPHATSPDQLYALLQSDGFKARVSCSPEVFPERMERVIGVPLALAAIPAGFDLLGWTYPRYFGEPVLSEDELVLMARVDGQDVAVVIDHDDQARRLRADDGLKVHRRELSGLVLFEISPFDTPRVLPLISAVDEK